MPLLDQNSFYDPQNIGLLTLGAGLLAGGGPSRQPTNFGGILGTAGGQALGAMQEARRQQMLIEQQAMTRQLQEAHIGHLGMENQKIQQELRSPGLQAAAWNDAFGPSDQGVLSQQNVQEQQPQSIGLKSPLAPTVTQSPLGPDAIRQPTQVVTAKSLPSTMNADNWFKYGEGLLKKGLSKEAEAAVQKGISLMGFDKASVHPDGSGGFAVFDREGNLLRTVEGPGGGQQARTAAALYQRYLSPPYNMAPDVARRAADASAFNLIRFVPDAQGGIRTMNELDAMLSQIQGTAGTQPATRPNPYAPAQQAGGQIGGASGSRGTEKLYEDVQQMSTAMDKKGIAGIDISMRGVVNKLKEYQNRPDELPGVGYLKNLPAQGSVGSLANFMLSDEGKNLKSEVQTVMNTVMHSEIGSQQTIQESVRQMQAILENPTSSARDFYNGWANLTRKINANKANIISGFAPEVHQEYGRRSKALKDSGYDAMDLSSIPIIDAQKPLASDKPLPSGKKGWKIEEIK